VKATRRFSSRHAQRSNGHGADWLHSTASGVPGDRPTHPRLHCGRAIPLGDAMEKSGSSQVLSTLAPGCSWYGPGRYQFADFVRVGTPLTVLIGLVTVLVAQLVWPS